MEQLQLIQSICNVEDDAGNRCSTPMSDDEIKQDGMCGRCAYGLWDSYQNDFPFLFSYYKD